MARNLELKLSLNLDSQQFTAQLSRAGQEVSKFSGTAQAGMTGAASGADRLAEALARVGHYGAGLLALHQVAGLAKSFLTSADAVTELSNRLRLSTGSATAAQQAYTALFEIAQRSRVGFAELGATFATLNRAGQEMGVSQQRMLAVTEAVGNAMTIGGGSAQSMQAALVQLGQGMASGVLRGEELNSVLEQAPRLAKALADGMGVSIGQLRALGADGKITAEQVVRALESQAQVLRGEVGSATMTASQAFTQLGNATLAAVGELDKATGASAAVARAISGAAQAVTSAGQAFRDHEGAIKGTLGALGGAATAAGVLRVAGAITGTGGVVAAIGATRTAFLALSATLAANPVGLALLGIGAVTGAVIAASGRPSSLEGVAREIEYTSERIAAAERTLERAGGSRGEMTRQLEARIAGMRRYRAELQQEHAGLAAASLDTRAEDARLANATAQMKVQKKAEEDLDKFRKNASGLPDSYFANMQEAIRLNQLGLLTGKEWTAFLHEQQKEVGKKLDPKGHKSGGLSVSDTELASLQAQLRAAQAYHEQLATLGAGASQLNAAEREALKIGEQLKRTTDAKTRARLMEKQAIADALGAVTRDNEGMERSAKAHQDLLDATVRDADGLNQRARAQEAANATLGKSRTAIEQMTLAELEHQMAEAQASDSFDPKYIQGLELKIAAQKRWVAALEQGDAKAAKQHVDGLLRGARDLTAAYGDELALVGLTALEREKIVAQRQVELKYAKELAEIDKLSEATAEQRAAKAARRTEVEQAQASESAAAVARVYQQHMARSSEEINRSLTDALMRGFESGKDFAKNFRDTLVNMFKTLVLRPTISAVLNPVAGAINGVVQGGLNAIGLGGAGGGGTGGIVSAGKSVLDLFGGASSASAIAANVSTGVAAGLTASEATAAATAAGQAAGGGFLTSIASAIPGWGWALGGLVALGGLFNGGETRSGASYAVDAAGRAQKTEGPSGGEIAGTASRAAIEATVGTINATFKALGSAASVSGFVAGLESSKNGKAFVFSGGKVGDAAFGEAAGRASVEHIGNATAEQATAAFALDLKQSTIQALQAAVDLPKSVTDMLSGIDAEQLTSEAADQLIATLSAQSQAVAGFREAVAALPFDGLKNLSYDAASAVLQTAGGLEAFKSAAQSYYSAFYSQEEQQAQHLANLTASMAALGETVPTTAEAFRALVDAAIAAGDAAKAARLMALASDVKGALDARAADQAASAAPAVGFMGFGPGQVYSSYGGGGGGGGGVAASGAASAADDLTAALKRLGESIGDEVTRLRGLMLDDSGQSRQVLLARFTTATAAARAGDRKALEELPELSRALEAATKASAVSSVEVARMRGWLAGSLSTTLQAREGKGTTTAFATVPAFAAGTNVVPRDMLALIHQGEAIVPKAFNPYLPQPQGGRARAGAGVEDGDLRALRGQLEALTGLSMDASLTGQRLLLRLLRIFENWERGGMPQPRNETWTPA